MLTEIATFPEAQKDAVPQVLRSLLALLSHMPNASGNDPMTIALEYRAGNFHFWLVTGQWKRVDDEVVAVFPNLPWEKPKGTIT